MSLPQPSDSPKQTVFAVPAHISAVTFSDGCRETHFPVNGAVDCAACAIAAQRFAYPPDPAAAAPEQPAANADVQSPSPAPVDASVSVAAVPAPDAPGPKSKKSTPDDAATSA